jgi:glutathione S-transferase
MSLTFYYAPMTTATITALVFAELAVPHETVVLDLKKGDTKKPEFLKLNPNGAVPAIVHDGTVIFESTAITMYLGETFGVEKNLYPAPGPKRGAAMAWITWANVTLGEAVGRVARHTSDWYPKDQQNVQAGAAAKTDLAQRLAVLDGALAGKSFLNGDYSLVDTHLNSLVDWIRMMHAADMTAFANVNAWSKRCAERPAYVKVMSAAAS